MRVAQLKIKNFRGISFADLIFSNHVVLVGDNNTGKSTIFEALDLVLGPDRLSKNPIVDEHDFYAGKYIKNESFSSKIEIETTVTNLSDEQKRFQTETSVRPDRNTHILNGGVRMENIYIYLHL